MLHFLPGPIKAVLTMILYIIFMVLCALVFFTFGILRLLCPWRPWRRFWYHRMEFMWELYCSSFHFFSKLFNKTQFEFHGLDGLSKKEWYLLISNHVAATDIVVLQMALNRKIPLLKFFIKKQLLWLPFAGWACKFMEFPFMARHSKKAIATNPGLRNQDYETTRRSCTQAMEMPSSVINFVEGTRITPKKHERQQSPFTYLLRPKAGGVALALSILEEKLKTILDVTIIYPDGGGLKQFLYGDVSKVIIHIDKISLSEDLIGDYVNDNEFRKHFQQWLNERWQKKDLLISQYKS